MKGILMSFNDMSSKKLASSANKPEDTKKAAPAIDATEVKPASLPEKVEPSLKP
jgi:hypothetical protein